MDQLWKRKLYPVFYPKSIWDEVENDNASPTKTAVTVAPGAVVSQQTPEELHNTGT